MHFAECVLDVHSRSLLYSMTNLTSMTLRLALSNNQSDKQEGSHCAYIDLELDALMAHVLLLIARAIRLD